MYMIPDEDLDAGIRHAMLHADLGRIYDISKKKKRLQLPDEDPLKIARDRRRAERAQLNSADGVTGETHDQFYRDHKLLLVLFRALAVMPITRSSPGKVTFSWKSLATAYAVFFYTVMTGVVFVVGRERIRILQTTKKFDDKIYAILFVIFLVPHFWIPFVGWGVATQVAVYKTMWATFQVRYYRITGKSLEFPRLKLLIVIISTGCLLCAILFLLSLNALLEGFLLWHTSAYVHIITMINMNCALWYINCRGIKEASKSLSRDFKADLQVEINAFIISQYRFLWLNLSEMLQALGNAYARTYSTYCLFMFVNITIAIYGAVSEMFDHGFGFTFKEMGLLVDATYCSILLFVFCDCSHKSTLTVCNQIRKSTHACLSFSFFFGYFEVAVVFYISNYDYTTPFHRCKVPIINVISNTLMAQTAVFMNTISK